MRALLFVLLCSVTLAAQQAGPALVTNADLVAGLPADGSKWLLYHGNYFGHRFSPLTLVPGRQCHEHEATATTAAAGRKNIGDFAALNERLQQLFSPAELVG